MPLKQQSLIVLALFVILLPLESLHAIVWLGHTLYEGIEYGLDILIHHLFGFDRRTTQLIVFYLMLSCALVAAFSLSKRLWVGYFRAQALCRKRYQELCAKCQSITPLATPKSLSVTLSTMLGLTVVGLLSF
ncbi:MAG: hypothetical protein RQ715_00120 [Methylococcales bacterium]|nr:hypothetical protein [Methylococcales bacterium]